MRKLIRVMPFLLVALLLSGCFVVVNDGEKTKVYGNREEEALDTFEKVGQKNPEDKFEIFVVK